MKAWVSKLQFLLRKHRIIWLVLNLALTTILFICSLKEKFELILTPRSVDEVTECNRLLFITLLVQRHLSNLNIQTYIIVYFDTIFLSGRFKETTWLPSDYFDKDSPRHPSPSPSPTSSH